MIKSGVRTSEFWLTVATHVAWVAALIFHRDVSAYVPAVATGMAAVTTAVYAASRAGLKKPTNLTNVVADAKAILPSLINLVEDGKTVAATLAAHKPKTTTTAVKAAPAKMTAPSKT